MRVTSQSSAEHKSHRTSQSQGLTLNKVMKAAVGALALCDLPRMAAAGGRSLLQDAAGPSLGSPFPEGAGPAVAPPAPGLVFKDPLIVANVTIPSPPPPPLPPPPPPRMGPPPLHNATMDGSGLAIPATDSVSDYNVANRASLSYPTGSLLHDTVSIGLRACMLCDRTHILVTPPLDGSDYVYPAFPPDGFAFQAIDPQIDVFHDGVYRDPDSRDFVSAYFVGSSGLDAALMGMSHVPYAPHSDSFFKAIGSDTTQGVSYVQWRLCGPNGQEWVSIDTRLPLDNNGVSYLSLTSRGSAERRFGAWPALMQKAYSKFLLEHPELSTDPTRPGLQNIVGNNPYHAMSAFSCNTPTVFNPHTPVGFGQTPVFTPLNQAILSHLNNYQQMVLMTTISDDIFTRDGIYDEDNDSVTYTYGANLRRSPINNFGQVLTYTAPNGGSTVIVPSHCYMVELVDPRAGTYQLTSPWGFSFTTNTAINGQLGPRSFMATADLLWAVGDQVFAVAPQW